MFIEKELQRQLRMVYPETCGTYEADKELLMKRVAAVVIVFTLLVGGACAKESFTAFGSTVLYDRPDPEHGSGQRRQAGPGTSVSAHVRTHADQG